MSSSISSSDAVVPRRYFGLAALVMAISLAAVWVWVACMPLAFLEPEYAAWRAKQTLLRDCVVGDILVLGDSRAAAGIIPARLPVPATNLAVGGGEAIEALAALTRALRCPTPPRLVVLSFDAAHFMLPELFWERTMRFGFLDRAEVADLRAVSLRLGDVSVYEERHTDGVPSWLRDQLYGARFPAYQFGSLLKGGVFMRWSRNSQAFAAALAARGHYYFGTAEGSGLVAAEGRLGPFRPLPVLEHYFDRILSTLSDHGIPAVFVAMPVNDATAQAMQPALRDGFAAWLNGYAARYPGFRTLGPTVLAWPDRWFGDGFSHLNPAGAERFSAALGPLLAGETTLAYRLQAAPPNTQNDAQ